MKTWHQHVVAARMAITEGHEPEGMRALVDKMIEDQSLTETERAELLEDTESRRILFWNGYEGMFSWFLCFLLDDFRADYDLGAVHRLLVVAETAIRHHEANVRARQLLTEIANPRSRAAAVSSKAEASISQPDLSEGRNFEKDGDKRKIELHRPMSR